MKLNRTIGLILGVALTGGLVGCPPQTDFNHTDVVTGMPTPPEDALYTILCQTYAGGDHVAVSTKVRDDLMKIKSMQQWYVVHAADKSMLYYGFYECINPRDPKDFKEGQRAVADQNTIRAMSDSHGTRFFSNCVMASIYSPDPAAEPKWDLLQSPGYWSLEVAVYKDTPNRKELAVAAVKAARAQGEEAYYYHGPSTSSVCIGSWPRKSVLELNVENQNSDPNSTVVVESGSLPSGVIIPGNAEKIKPTVEIEDPTLIQSLQTHHEHALNGFTIWKPVTDPKTGATTKVAEQPLLVRIPDRVETSASITDPSAARGEFTPSPAAQPKGGDDSMIDDPTTAVLRGMGKK